MQNTGIKIISIMGLVSQCELHSKTTGAYIMVLDSLVNLKPLFNLELNPGFVF